MSVLSELQEIRKEIGEEEFQLIEKYLEEHPDVLLCQVYFNEEAYKKYLSWKENR